MFRRNFHAIVSKENRPVEIPRFSTITEALEYGKTLKAAKFNIYLKEGIYNEVVIVDFPGVSIIGEEGKDVIIKSNRTSQAVGIDEPLSGTWECSVLTISAPGFYAENIVFENSFDYPANAIKADGDPSKIVETQAVAFMTRGDADKTEFHKCSFIGFQDTLFIDGGRHYFKDCSVSGHVDFIFGGGQAVFDECAIQSRNRKNKNPTGYVTAPSTHIADPYGFLFYKCRFVKESDVPAGSVRLGRPWHPRGDLSCSGAALFYKCFMDDHIGEKGYDRISAGDGRGGKIWFDLKPDSRFFEYGTYGPGAMISVGRPRLADSKTRWFAKSKFLDNWIPENYGN